MIRKKKKRDRVKIFLTLRERKKKERKFPASYYRFKRYPYLSSLRRLRRWLGGETNRLTHPGYYISWQITYLLVYFSLRPPSRNHLPARELSSMSFFVATFPFSYLDFTNTPSHTAPLWKPASALTHLVKILFHNRRSINMIITLSRKKMEKTRNDGDDDV